MIYYLLDIDIDIDFNKFIIGNKIKLCDNNYRQYIYYFDKKPKNILIKFPPSRLVFDYKNNKYNQIKLPIYPMWEDTKKFICFIKKIEKFIKEKVNLDKKFISCLDKKDKIKFVKLNINDNLKIITNDDSNLYIHDLKANGEIEGIINFNYIWIKDDKYGISVNLQQLQYDYFNYFEKKTIVKPVENSTVIKPIGNSTVIKPVEEILPQSKTPFKISTDLLNQAKLKLNKIN
jgi:hypothetical protein